jgi:hypothetical protein
MGLNYLLHRHQVSLMRSDAASCVSARSSHRALAVGYARQIEQLVQPARQASTPLVPLS